MPLDMETLTLGQQYSFERIEAWAKKKRLFPKVNDCLEPSIDWSDIDCDLDEEIGEIVLPLYFEDGSVAVNFILAGLSFTSSTWRCIYACSKLSLMNKEQIAHQATSLLQDAILDVIPRVQQLYDSGAIDPESYPPDGEMLAEVLTIAAVRDILDKRTARLGSKSKADLKNLKHF